MTKTHPHKEQISLLKRILKKGAMSPLLKTAVNDALNALEEGNVTLAANLTACKSYVTGKIDPNDTRNAFQEDQETNEEALGNSLYSLLDGIHFCLAMASKQMPAGMITMGVSNGKTVITERETTGSHPVIRRMKAEHKRIIKETSEIF